jgi:hypothetical protein
MSFVTHSGRAWFDGTGVATCGFAAPAQQAFGADDVVWCDDAPPSGANRGRHHLDHRTHVEQRARSEGDGEHDMRLALQ